MQPTTTRSSQSLSRSSDRSYSNEPDSNDQLTHRLSLHTNRSFIQLEQHNRPSTYSPTPTTTSSSLLIGSLGKVTADRRGEDRDDTNTRMRSTAESISRLTSLSTNASRTRRDDPMMNSGRRLSNERSREDGERQSRNSWTASSEASRQAPQPQRNSNSSNHYKYPHYAIRPAHSVSRPSQSTTRQAAAPPRPHSHVRRPVRKHQPYNANRRNPLQLHTTRSIPANRQRLPTLESGQYEDLLEFFQIQTATDNDEDDVNEDVYSPPNIYGFENGIRDALDGELDDAFEEFGF